MKLRVGKFLIETDYIEMVEWLSPHTAKLYFLYGTTLDVVCGIKTTSPATWDQDASAFLETLQHTDFENPDAATFKVQDNSRGR